MTLEIKSLTMGIVATNCYLVADTTTNKAIVIDPVDEADTIMSLAQQSGWEIALIVATHGHFDHVLASKSLKEKTGAPFYIHEDSMPFLDRLPQTGIRFTGQPFPEAATPDRFLATESEIIELDQIRLKTLYTPGHAPGHLSFFMEDQKILFSGDSLFKGSVGRTDLPGADHNLLMTSIVEKLIPLGDDIQVLPGHMQPTTIGFERQTNPFILSFIE